eukprot:NODE_13565_length_432_cov_0.809836_g13542_i0.p2 GENE.NODE_13565_length_432_cov_0.809836_g13542_i0~~NODE_13565_length_432_cov_0.809836_g13542_i0.p2  ORF type:complete len:104 (+),score=11.18 NODE_13565_length_432_cov_0.809836_g13542_i0:71-382(+)
MSAAVSEVLPKAGLVYSEKSTLSEILSKPKIMALKSITMEQLEKMEEDAKKIFADAREPEQQIPDRPMSSSGRPTSSAGRNTAARPQSASGGRPTSSAGRSSA